MRLARQGAGRKELLHFMQRFQVGGYELASLFKTHPPCGVELFQVHFELRSISRNPIPNVQVFLAGPSAFFDRRYRKEDESAV